jgi:acyl-CoA synthetase (AMP-forming)/AMP-acid ligase II
VRDVAVVGVPDPKWGDVVTAIIELRGSERPSFEELRQFAKERIAGYKCPRQAFLSLALPRTASGKIQRGAAKAVLQELERIH